MAKREIKVHHPDDVGHGDDKYLIDVGEDAKGNPEESTFMTPEEWENWKANRSDFPITVDDDEWEEIKRQMEAFDD